MVEVMFAVRKDQFKDFHAIVDELDLVMEEDQFTHLLTLEDAINPEDILNVFKADPDFQENEEKYSILKKEILGEAGSDDEEDGGSGSGSDDEDDSDIEEDEEAKQKIIDQTETNMVALKRTIYLTIQSSLDFEECAHKLLKMDLKPGQEVELCYMILDCCAQMRTYEKFFGLLAGRFCMIDRKYVLPFQEMFAEQYGTIHRLETQKLRNVAKFFAHLLFTDSMSWAVLMCIKLNEDDTTSASRIFIKILFQELSEFLGLPKLNERLKDPTLQEYYAGLLPRDNPRDTRFAINFFTTIGLGGLTDDLRDHLKNVSKKLMQQKQEEQETAANAANSSDNSSQAASSDDSSSESSASDSSSDSDSSAYGKRSKKKNKKKQKERKKTKKSSKEGTQEKSKTRGKDGKKDKTNGNFNEKSIRNEKDKDGKKGKKKKNTNTDKDFQKEHQAKFMKLANYGNIEEVAQPTKPANWDGGAAENNKSNNSNSKKAGKRNRARDDYEAPSSDDQRVDRYGDRVGRESRGEVPAPRREFDRSYERQSSLDSRDGGGRGSDWGSGRDLRGRGQDDQGSGRNDSRGRGQDDQGSGRNDSRGRDSGPIFRDFRTAPASGGDKSDGKPRGGRGRKEGRGKKGGGDVSLDDRDDENIRVERTFERLDLYEDKFEKERERNVENVRYGEDFQDFYRGRGNEDDKAYGRGRDSNRERDSSRDSRDMYRGGRSRGEGPERFDRQAPPALDGDSRRRGRNRSVDTPPAVIRRDERRKRR